LFQDESAGNSSIWDIVSLVKSLQLLFPGAAVSNTVVSEVWNARCLQSDKEASKMSPFAKARLLATIKVMCRKQVQYTRTSNDSFSASKKSVVGGLSCMSVHGVVRIKAGGWDLSGNHTVHGSTSNHSTFAVVDASHAAIIIRPQLADFHSLLNVNTVRTDGSFTNHYHNALYTTGCLAEGEDKLLKQLYSTCLLQPVPLHKLMSSKDASEILGSMNNYSPYIKSEAHDLLMKIHAKYAPSVPLPSGCWFDGEFYMDFHGARTNIRPDIDKLVDMYIADYNSNAVKHNKMVNLVSRFM